MEVGTEKCLLSRVCPKLTAYSIIRIFDHRNAVVIYFSDHGEEVHNFREQTCRTISLG